MKYFPKNPASGGIPASDRRAMLKQNTAAPLKRNVRKLERYNIGAKSFARVHKKI